jgi:hypothetical protein
MASEKWLRRSTLFSVTPNDFKINVFTPTFVKSAAKVKKDVKKETFPRTDAPK